MGKISLLKKKDLKIQSKLKLCEAYKNHPKKERQKMYSISLFQDNWILPALSFLSLYPSNRYMYYYNPQISPENKQEAYSIKCFYRGELET